MADKLHKTNGIVLKNVKYGETSLIVTLFTELFGLQSYIINSVRTSTKKGPGKANMFQPGAILDLVVYHNENKQLNRIKEFKWQHLYRSIFSDVIRNAVALFMVELMSRTIREPENNPDLYHFAEDSFIHLDSCSENVAANFPLFFALHLSHFFGFRIDDNYSESRPVLDLQEGSFTDAVPAYHQYLEGKQAAITSEILKTMQPSELEDLLLNHEFRRSLLEAYERFYALHLPDFGSMKTLPVLREILR